MTTDGFKYGYDVNTKIRDKYHHGFARMDDEVSHLIVHGTAGGTTASSCLSWMMAGGKLADGSFRRDDYRRGVALFQYIIDRSGAVIEVINPHNFVYHSSIGAFDRFTIGVELVNTNRDNGGSYNSSQYVSLAELYNFLRERFKNMYYIQGHGSIKFEKTGKTKQCPGTGFDWRLFNLVLIDFKRSTVIQTEKIEVV